MELFLAISLVLGIVGGPDKTLHHVAGLVISDVVTKETGSRELGCLAATIAGVVKESIDVIPDPFDLVATIVGGCVIEQNNSDMKQIVIVK